MPDNNLGTAHGRIRIEYEGRGAEKANAAIVRMAAQFEQMNKRLARIEKSLKDTNVELEDTSAQMRKVSRSSSILSGNILQTHRRFRSFRNDVGYLKDDMQALYRGVQVANKGFSTLATTMRIFNRAGQFNSNQQLAIFRALSISVAELSAKTEGAARNIHNVQQGIVNFFGASNQALAGTRSILTLTGAGYVSLRNKVFGFNKAIDQAPNWVKKLNGVERAVRVMAGSFGLLAVAIGPLRLLERLASTGVFNTLVKGFSGMATSVERFGRITQRVLGRDFTSGFVKSLRNAEGSMTTFLADAGTNFARLGARVSNTAVRMKRFADDSKYLIGGIALLTNSITRLWGRFQWFFKLPKPLMAAFAIFTSRVLPTALHGIGKALQGVSNFMAGLVDGAIQLSGALLTLPGLFAGIGAAAAGIFPIFAGLKDAFKDLFDVDPVKRFEALGKLPVHLRGIGSALQSFYPRWQQFLSTVQSRAFIGLEQQIVSLGNRAFPIWERGSLKMADSLRKAKDELVAFLGEARTLTDINTIFDNTNGIMLNLGKMTRPVAQGFRDIAVVGTEFFRTMSAFGPEVSRRFQEWATANRENGNLMRWMNDARSGIYDLARGLKEAAQFVYELLTVFQTRSGDNFLEHFANSMEKLNKRVQESKIDGLLARIRAGVQNMGQNHLGEMIQLFKIFGDAIKGITPFIVSVSETFSDKFIPIMQFSLEVITNFLQVLNDTGISKFIGYILGIFGAVKLLPKVLATTIDSLKLFLGTFAIMRNKDKVLNGIENAAAAVAARMEHMGRAGAVAGNGLINVTNAATRTAAVLGSLVNAALGIGAAFLAFYALYNTGSKSAEEFNKQLDENKKHVAEFRRSLDNAFKEDRGLMGRSVMSSISDGLDQMMTDLDATAKEAPGFGDHLYDLIFRKLAAPMQIGKTDIFNESEIINEAQRIGTQAELASKGLQKLRDDGVDLTAVMASSDSEFINFIENQRKLGDEGNAAADALIAQRKQLDEIKRAYERIGPGGAQLAEGIQQIAEAGSDATEKLDGLKNVLEALGILKTNSIQAAADYEQALDDLSGKIDDLVVSAGGLSRDKLMTGDTFNTATQEGRDFADVMASLGEEFMANVSAGANAQAEYAKFEQRLAGIAEQTKIPIEELKRLAEQVGLTPDKVGVSIQLTGKGQATQDLYQTFLEMEKAIKDGVKVPVELKPGDAEQAKNDINRILDREAAEVGSGGTLLIKPGISQADLQKVASELSAKGIQIPGAGPPVAQATMPIGPSTAATGDINKGGISEPERAAADGLNQAAVDAKEVVETQFGEIQRIIDGTTNEARDAGSKFVDEYAAGLESNPAAKQAADRLAEEVMQRFHRSPPKKGPLSLHGDAAKYAGGEFVTSYAYGLEANAGRAGQASNRVAGAASMGLQGDKNYEAGQFLGQISSIVSFLEHAVEAFSKIATAVFDIAKFASDPLGKGTFFGKRPRYIRDPNVSDEMLAQRKADAAQQRMFDFYNSGQRPNNDMYDPRTGRIKGKEPGTLTPGAGPQDIANYIMQKAMSQGYSREQANMFVIQAVGESGLNPASTSPNGLWKGIYQFDTSTWEQAGGGDITDPQKNIDNYFNLAAQRGLTPESFKTGSQLGNQVSIGGPYADSNAAQGHLKAAQDAAQKYIDNFQEGVGQTVDGIAANVPAAIGNLPQPTKLTTEPGLEPGAMALASILEQQFPGITNIGGKEPRSGPQMHPQGRALDVGIGDDLALGDQINAFIQANASKFGVQSTIWRDVGKNLVANEGGPPGSTYTAGGHFDHVHVQFADGTKLDVASDGTMNFNVPADSPYANLDYSAPPTPEELAKPPGAPTNLVVRNPDGTFSPVHGGAGRATPGPMGVNPATGQLWTPEEAAEFWNRPENAIQYDASILKPGDQQVPGVYQGPQDQMLEELKQQTPLLKDSLDTLKNPDASNEDVINAIENLEAEQERQQQINTPQSRATAQAIGSEVSNAVSERGLTQATNPIDAAASIGGSAASIAGDIFAVINSVIESIVATKDITSTFARGVENTEDLYRMVDDIQNFIQVAADIAGAVASVLDMTGAILSAVAAAGAADPTGGGAAGLAAAATSVQGAANIASIVQAVIESVNAIIDLAQEAYRIVGSYVGEFLGILVGGPGGALEGNVKFLLDQATGELLAYSQDNPLDKRSHGGNPEASTARNQMIGNINVYGGPGQDPRDNTRQMMYQVKASQMSIATGQ